VPWQVDDEGYVMPPLDPRQRAAPANQVSEQLAILSGLEANTLQPGRRIESRQVQAALQLILAFENSPMAGLVELKRIDVSAPGVLTATTSQGSEITFGLKDPETQLLRWREIYDRGLRVGRAIASLDLALSNNIPARWLDAATLPPAPSKPIKPLH